MEIVLYALAFLFFIQALHLFLVDRTNIVALLQIFNSFFFFIPAIQSYSSNTVGEIAALYSVSVSAIEGLDIIIIGLFLLTSSIFLLISPKKMKLLPPKKNRPNSYVLAFEFFLIALWFVVFFNILNEYSYSLWNLLTPARKGIILSGVVQIFIIVIPQVLLSSALIFHNNKFRVISYATLLIMSGIILGQRREILTAILIVILMSSMYSTRMSFFIGRISKKTILTAILIIALVPLTWYLRSAATQLQRDSEVVVNPFELRSPVELVFGSFASGYQSFLILKKFESEDIFDVGDSFSYLATAFVPRVLMPEKSMTPTQKIRFIKNYDGNVSIFLIGEMFFNFWYFFVPAFFLFNYLLHKLIIYTNKNLQYISVYLVVQSVYIFKNGVAQFLPIFVIYILLMGVLFKLVRLKYNK